MVGPFHADAMEHVARNECNLYCESASLALIHALKEGLMLKRFATAPDRAVFMDELSSVYRAHCQVYERTPGSRAHGGGATGSER